MFGSLHPPAPKICFRFSENFGAEGGAFLKWLCNVLDDADVHTFLKTKGSSFLPWTREKKREKPEKKKTVKTNSIIIKNGGNEHIVSYAPETSQFFSCYD